MPTALHRFIVTVLLLLPLAANAGDAEDFLAANPTQQAKLLQDWAAQPDPARIELVDALQQGQLTLNGETKTVRLNNRLRGLIDNVQASQQLLAADPKVRLAAARTLQKARNLRNSNSSTSRSPPRPTRMCTPPSAWPWPT